MRPTRAIEKLLAGFHAIREGLIPNLCLPTSRGIHAPTSRFLNELLRQANIGTGKSNWTAVSVIKD